MTNILTNRETQLAIQAELAAEPGLNHSGIAVDVASGVVTLTGSVPSYVDALTAKKAALRVPGVCAVACELNVELPAESRRTDRELASLAAQVLASTVHVPPGVKVVVEQGHLTLAGEAAWPFEKEAAELAVAHLTGVEGVHNEIQVRAPSPAAGVRASYAAALQGSSVSDTSHIHIHASDGVLILTGTVCSCADRDEAVRLAWNMPGVTKVESRLHVMPAGRALHAAAR